MIKSQNSVNFQSKMYEKMRKYQSFKQQQFNAKQITRSYSSSQQNSKPILLNNLYSSINTNHLNSNINNKTGQFNKQKSTFFNGTLPFPGRFSSSSLINPQKQHILQKQKQSHYVNINNISRKSKSKQTKNKQCQAVVLNNINNKLNNINTHKPKKIDKSFQKNKSILKDDEQKILKQNISKLKKYYTTAVNIEIDQNKQNNSMIINVPIKQKQSHKKQNSYKKKYQKEIKQNVQRIDKLNQQINQLKSIISMSKNQIKVIKKESTKMEESFKFTILEVLKIFTICQKFGQKNTKHQKSIELNNQIVKVISKEIVELFKSNNIHFFIQKFNIKNELNLYSNNQNESIESQITFTEQQRVQCRQQFLQLFSGKNLLDTFNNNSNQPNPIPFQQKQISHKPLKSIYSQFTIQLQQQQQQHNSSQQTHPRHSSLSQKQMNSSNICRKLFTEEGNINDQQYDNHDSEVNQFITEFNNNHNQGNGEGQGMMRESITPRLAGYCFQDGRYISMKDGDMKRKIQEKQNVEEDSLTEYTNAKKQSNIKSLSKSKAKHKKTQKSHKKHHQPHLTQFLASCTYSCITSYPPKQSNLKNKTIQFYIQMTKLNQQEKQKQIYGLLNLKIKLLGLWNSCIWGNKIVKV